MKNATTLFLAIILLAAPCAAYANHGGGGGSLEGKYYGEVTFLMRHKDELGLNDEQVQALKDRKFEVRRQDIQIDSQLELLMLDLQKELNGDAPNPEKLNGLIDQKMEMKKTLNKAFAGAIVDARKLLTPEQRAKAKEIMWKEFQGGHGGGRYCSRG